MVYSAIIVDDEQAAHHALRRLLTNHNGVSLVGQAYNGKQAIELINSLKPDIVFLDVQMPDRSGLDLLRDLSHQPYIVFCTAYDQYAVEAFNHNSIDYLLKPVDDKRFAQCMDKIKKFVPRQQDINLAELLELYQLRTPPKKASAIPIKVRSKISFVQCEKISYCLAKDGYSSLITIDGEEHVSDLTLKQLEERLPDNFIRVQKSYIVNKTRIEEIHKYFNNRLILIMSDHYQTKITTGTSYIHTIREELFL